MFKYNFKGYNSRFNYKIYKKVNKLKYNYYGETTLNNYVDENEFPSKRGEANGYVFYRVTACDTDGNESTFSNEIKIPITTNKIVTSLEKESLLDKIKFHQNYPNPFNSSTIIKYSVSYTRHEEPLLIKLYVFDIIGQEVAELVNEYQRAGDYKVRFDSSKFAKVSCGIYLFRLSVGNQFITKKGILLK